MLFPAGARICGETCRFHTMKLLRKDRSKRCSGRYLRLATCTHTQCITSGGYAFLSGPGCAQSTSAVCSSSQVWWTSIAFSSKNVPRGLASPVVMVTNGKRNIQATPSTNVTHGSIFATPTATAVARLFLPASLSPPLSKTGSCDDPALLLIGVLVLSTQITCCVIAAAQRGPYTQ